uniref:Cytochrome P450 4C1 n=1 Tax=Culex pipiens TaxID=7175 RepID=A0A8D8BK52_CULPI
MDEVIFNPTIYLFFLSLHNPETAMGVKVHAQTDGENEYVKAIYALSELFLDRLVRPWLHNNYLFKRSEYGQRHQKAIDIVHGYTKKVIRDRKELLRRQRESNGEGIPAKPEDTGLGVKKRLAFLDLLLQGNEKSNQLSDDDVREEVDTFMFEVLPGRRKVRSGSIPP